MTGPELESLALPSPLPLFSFCRLGRGPSRGAAQSGGRGAFPSVRWGLGGGLAPLESGCWGLEGVLESPGSVTLRLYEPGVYLSVMEKRAG